MQEKKQPKYNSGLTGGIGLPPGVSGVYRPATDGSLPKTYQDQTYGSLRNLNGDHSNPNNRDEPSAQQLADPGSVFSKLYQKNPDNAA